ncbi:hypothetical protein EDC01DRAFT_780202 [Geopyxis carbonaria]|nr:hypothetical protein EDC01DRAFT_780202 [Geopyxis carbonaria]
MPPPPHKETGIRLPRALLDELKLDESGAPKSKGKNHKGANPRDRKALRKQQRQEKKSRRSHHAQNGPTKRGLDFDEDDEDGDDGLGSAAEEATPPPAPAPRSTKKIEAETKSTKSILKTATKSSKRKALEDESDEEPQPRKKKSLSKGVQDKLAEDHAEVAYLEKKLKIKNKKTPKSFAEDGLDFLLEGLKDDYLDDRAEKAVKINKRDRRLDFEDDSDDEEMSDEDDGLDDLLNGLGSEGESEGDEEDDDEDDEDDEGSDDEDMDEDDDSNDEDVNEDEEEFEGFSDTEATSTTTPAPADEEVPTETKDISAPAPFVASANKYIPPSLRKAATTESEELLRLRRQVQGLLNRLSEANLITILNELEEIYRSNPRGDVTNLLTNIIISTVGDRSSMLDTFMILHGGFVAGIYKIMGTDVGAHVVQRVVEDFYINHAKTNGIADPAAAGKECTNLMSFLAELYNFQVVGAVLIFDFIRFFLSELTELHTELLLKIVRNSGPQLRSDDPTALKSLVLLLQPAIAKAGGSENLSIRTKFMIETLTNLKNNLLKSTNAASVVTAETTTRMKKLLGTLNTRRLRATEPLRASLDDIKNTETKGKWWLVGASWAGNNNATEQPTVSVPKETTYQVDSDSDDGFTDLQALARQHRMNTDIRRAIFITLLSAKDFSDAHTRLMKLRLKRSQEREIPRVLLHCAAGEATYNPYYTLIAKKLCSSHALRMTFTFTLWEYFRRFGEDDGSGKQNAESDDEEDEEDSDVSSWNTKVGLRKLVNLARLYGTLISSTGLSLSILKTLNWAYLQPATKSFLVVLFTTIFTSAESSIDSAFGPFQLQTHPDLCRGILHFLKKRVKKADVAADEEEKKLVKQGVASAIAVLEDILKEL